MTESEMILEHIANNHRFNIELARIIWENIPSARHRVDYIASEHLRVNKDIQAEYLESQLTNE